LLLPFVAVAAGELSFSSPCCLPLLPSYVSYMAGVADGATVTAARRTTLVRAAGFVAGFTAVFTALGALAGLLGATVVRHLLTVIRVSGILIIAMGIAMVGVIRVPALNRERRLVPLHRVGRGPGSAVLLGAAFAAGWVPCIGPVLATILATAATTETVGWGMTLLALYSIGLGLPFVALALGLHHVQRSVSWLRRHALAIERLSGLLLVAIGVLFVTGTWRTLLLPLQRELARLGWPPI
jgi:cytochrome c-type biogenesis protein